MTTKISDAEAILLAKRVAKNAADRTEVGRSDYYQRSIALSIALLVWSVGLPAVGGYGRELAAYFGTSRILLGVVVVLAGGLAIAGVEIAILRRKVESLARLLQSASRDA